MRAQEGQIKSHSSSPPWLQSSSHGAGAMLSMNSVMLIYLLDSEPYQSVLGGSVRNGALREQVRGHVKQLVHTLLSV